ncbi:serine protease [Amycolatopsis acidicola]|uniref:Serine protease n=1 Tax=Amycolatopsis acidicola TaxID=2596893 RepID=A0A5N0V8E9_9PSEU|nr:serine protease [Amycolatopsis acidicola]KAA9162315.1 serine protease [Amycolatopsis acidicola]
MAPSDLRRAARRLGVPVLASAALLAGMVLNTPGASAISQGTEAPAGSAPWMATLAFAGTDPLTRSGYCGGTLIAPDRVLTAGHCVLDKSPADFQVYLGADRLSRPRGAAHQVRGWFWHPGWRKIDTKDGTFAADDLAVVVLDQPVRGVRPARIASPVEVSAAVAASGTGTVYGHGSTEQTTGMTDRLQQATMKLLAPQQCAPNVPQDSVGDNGFCVTGVPSGSGAAVPSICPGDSGGPLLLTTAEGPEVAGVLSAQSGDGCDGSAHQGEFMNPADWRQQALRPNPELAPTGTLRITGTAGQSLTAEVGGLTPASAQVGYEWFEEKDDGDGFKYNVPVEGATNPSLPVSGDLVGKQLECIATLTSPAGEVQLKQSVHT